jgi:hypothetical protein
VVVEGRGDGRWATWDGDEVSDGEAGSNEVSNSKFCDSEVLAAMEEKRGGRSE